MFGIIKSLTKAAVGIVLSPVSIAADILTLGGAINERDEPYTISSVRDILSNIENAVNPYDLSDSELREIARELNRRN